MEKQYEVKVEKMIERKAADVFRAIQEGRLFFNCSADSSTSKIDFRVGGKYHIAFKSYGIAQFGEFLEIVPDQKIVFTWCESFEEPRTANTKVSIELFPDGTKTKLKLTHSGFHTEAGRDDHEQGWMSGLTDLFEEIQTGKIRMMRTFNVPVNKLFDACKNPKIFYAAVADTQNAENDFRVGGKFTIPNTKGTTTGEYIEITSNHSIAFTWNSTCANPPVSHSKVTLLFHEEDDGGSSLELIHEGLKEGEQQKQHRLGWEVITNAFIDQWNKS